MGGRGFWPHLCETLCEKMIPKPAKTWKICQNLEIKSQAFSTCCNKLRRLCSSGVLTENPRVPSSILGPATIDN
jgi:hypothetical protein